MTRSLHLAWPPAGGPIAYHDRIRTHALGGVRPSTAPPLRTVTDNADIAFMQEALALAERSIGLSDPNPRVGCIIVAADGRTIGRGFTQQAGGPHAEVVAIRDAQSQGHDLQGATVYVTLEPCAHHGRTPPCADALVAAGVARVVAAVDDPFPDVAGRGLARLQAAGITVQTGVLAKAARAMNIGFFSRFERQRPWVRLKVAVSLDGRTALANGASQWITGEPARRDTHAWRKRSGAVLTGIGTVRDDDPRLDVRWVATDCQPLRVVLDSRFEMPMHARILQAPGSVRVYGAVADAPGRAALEALGAATAALPNAQGQVDLPAVLHDLAAHGVNELHVEAGHLLNASFVKAGLVDEFLIYMAPKLLGEGRSLAALGPLASLADAVGLRFTHIETIGDDLRIIARPLSPDMS